VFYGLISTRVALKGLIRQAHSQILRAIYYLKGKNIYEIIWHSWWEFDLVDVNLLGT